MNLGILAFARNDPADDGIFTSGKAKVWPDIFWIHFSPILIRWCFYAGIHRKIFGFHRLLSKRFPYGIYYQFNGQDVIVYRVLDLRKNPRKIRTALKSGG